jgi:cysteine desulfurase/selenocysteine lyase
MSLHAPELVDLSVPLCSGPSELIPVVIEAVSQYYERDNANVHRGIHELSNRATAGFEAARSRTARFINARSADEIVFTRGTTEGINLVAYSWGTNHLKPGDKILLTEMEHHSNLVPWQMLAERTGARLVYLPVTGDEGLLDLSRLDQCSPKRSRCSPWFTFPIRWAR